MDLYLVMGKPDISVGASSESPTPHDAEFRINPDRQRELAMAFIDGFVELVDRTQPSRQLSKRQSS